VLVTIALPTRNVDGSTPVDLSRVELHALTASAAPTAARLIEGGSLVATWEPPAGEEAAPGAASPIAATEIVLREVLTPEALSAGSEPAAAEAEGPAPAEPPTRYYAAVPFGDRGRAGPQGRVVPLPLAEPPDPPPSLSAAFDEHSVTLLWTPARTRTQTPADAAVRYDVYLRPEGATGPGDARVVPPVARNATPLSATTFAEPVALDGARRCYEVRALRGQGAAAIAGRPSPEACVTPVDTFPPSAPTGLNAIELQGAIDLTWVANQEPDVAGYLVLRGEPGDATLTALTAEPITATRYVDRDVRTGVRYTYAVKAVDGQPRPNESVESARLERTAR